MGDMGHSLSVRLYQILDAIGASEDVRTLWWEDAMTEEILKTVCGDDDFSMYRFCSSCEGTTTPGLFSDVDVLCCDERVPVVEKIEDAPEYGRALLMISDADTKPGYFKLQEVYNRVPQTIYQREIDVEWEDTDTQGRICFKHLGSKDPAYVRNGPAETGPHKDGFRDKDLVVALRCKKIPNSVLTWQIKTRPCNWPSKSHILKMKTFGCFFVGVGHPRADNKHIEWRISFSLQERELMSSLNPTQHKCYILLKIIKKDIIQPRAGEKSISSYHCKTCLFFVLENSKPGLWNRRNLIQGVRVCLSVLLHWVRRRNCPNYFISEENIFDKLDRKTLDKIEKVMVELLKSGTRFLFSLQCDHIGSILSGNFSQIRNESPTMSEYKLLYETIQNLYMGRNLTLIRAIRNVQDSTSCLFELFYFFQNIRNPNMVIDRSIGDVIMVMDLFLPLLHLQIAQSIASVLRIGYQANSIYLFRAFRHSLKKSACCDLISSKLIVATCYLLTDMLDHSKEVLLTCETKLKFFVISLCSCRMYLTIPLQEQLKKAKLSIIEFRSQCTTGCLLFVPAQANLVHPALQLEMYRSVYTPPGSRHERKDFWYDWILVDSRVYLYFLQYLLYSKTNNTVCKNDAIDNLMHVINTDPNLGHRETACNLLGWIMIQEGRLQDALRCLLKSWRIRADHNAAKWHLCVLIAEVYRRTRHR